MTAKPERRLCVCGSFGSLLHTRCKRKNVVAYYSQWKKKVAYSLSLIKINGEKKAVASHSLILTRKRREKRNKSS